MFTYVKLTRRLCDHELCKYYFPVLKTLYRGIQEILCRTAYFMSS